MVRQIFAGGLFSGSLIYLFCNLLAAAMNIALLPVLTRYLTTAEYGQVAIFQTLMAGLGTIVGLNSLGAASVKYYDSALSATEMKRYLGQCLLIVCASGSFLLIGAILAKETVSTWLGLSAFWMLVAVPVSCAGYVVSLRLSQWQIRKRALHFGVFQVSQSLLNVALSLMLVAYFLEGANGRMLALSLLPVLFAVFAVISLYRDNLLGFAWRPTYLAELLRFGVPLLPHSVGLFLLSSADRFIVLDMLGLSQVGIYMVAVQVTAAMGLVFDAINNAYVPWLFERLTRNKVAEKRAIVRWTYAYFLILLTVVAIAFLVGPTALVLIAGPKYQEASGLIGWLALGQAFNGMYLMVTNYIFYARRTAWLSAATITSGLINIGLIVLLVSFRGLEGAAIAFAASAGVKFLITWLVASISHPMPWFTFEARDKYA